MRRIYDSEALRRDDDEPLAPNEADSSVRPQAMRSVDAGLLSRLVVPQSLRHRAISVGITTPKTEYAIGERVPFRVTMKNAMPFPISISTRSPLLWTWDVDGVTEASHVPLHDPPDESGRFEFDRGERKQFTRRWTQQFRISENEWEPVRPGEYTIGARINVEDAERKGLYDETSVHVRPE